MMVALEARVEAAKAARERHPTARPVTATKKAPAKRPARRKTAERPVTDASWLFDRRAGDRRVAGGCLRDRGTLAPPPSVSCRRRGAVGDENLVIRSGGARFILVLVSPFQSLRPGSCRHRGVLLGARLTDSFRLDPARPIIGMTGKEQGDGCRGGALCGAPRRQRRGGRLCSKHQARRESDARCCGRL